MIKIFICILLPFLFSCKENEVKSNLKVKQKSENKVSNELLFSIEGSYRIENDSMEVEKCNLEMLIAKKDNHYEYVFKSGERELNGKISLELNENNNGYYITFEGIEWSEYKGNIDEGNEDNSLGLPVGIQGLLYENEISIQNYGNSMNYYVQLYDCGKKFITLIKK